MGLGASRSNCQGCTIGCKGARRRPKAKSMRRIASHSEKTPREKNRESGCEKNGVAPCKQIDVRNGYVWFGTQAPCKKASCQKVTFCITFFIVVLHCSSRPSIFHFPYSNHGSIQGCKASHSDICSGVSRHSKPNAANSSSTFSIANTDICGSWNRPSMQRSSKSVVRWALRHIGCRITTNLNDDDDEFLLN